MLWNRKSRARTFEKVLSNGRPKPEMTPGYGGRGGTFFRDMFETDHVEIHPGERFRWMLSTCLAAAIGAVAILVVIRGSAETNVSDDGLLPGLQTFHEATANAAILPSIKNADGLRWSMPKSDRLRLTTGSLSTRYIIHESSKSRRDGREYVRQKPYARIVARLAPVPSEVAEKIPKFNPFKLYVNSSSLGRRADEDDAAGSGLSKSNVEVKVVELLGGILPGEDGQELDVNEVKEIINRRHQSEIENAQGNGPPLDGVGGLDIDADPGTFASDSENVPLTTYGHVTEIEKSTETSEEEIDILEDGEVRVVKVGTFDTLSGILQAAGAVEWQARAMIEAAQSIFPESAVVPGQEVRITVVPSLVLPDAKEPARFSVFSDGHDHLVTVTRNAAGEYIASAQPSISEELRRLAENAEEGSTKSSLFASVYYAGLMQSLAPETIQEILTVNAFDNDFRRNVRPGDTLEMFFDMNNAQSTNGPPGKLLYTALGSGNTVHKFYRFKTRDGIVDFYNEKGNNSKKFLLRKPVRSEDIRLTSGYSLRYHPLLNTRKMHAGVDWAASHGTPIIAGGNGTIEEIGRKGYYGNYIRIRHANGYATAYGHMSKFASGLSRGDKVRQGQTIGYIGTTGLSSGPHLHYEVLVNGRFVNPMSIQVPRERKLEGKDLIAFQKERARIDELMRRAPVMTANK